MQNLPGPLQVTASSPLDGPSVAGSVISLVTGVRIATPFFGTGFNFCVGKPPVSLTRPQSCPDFASAQTDEGCRYTSPVCGTPAVLQTHPAQDPVFAKATGSGTSLAYTASQAQNDTCATPGVVLGLRQTCLQTAISGAFPRWAL